jgi:hypothetical protein
MSEIYGEYFQELRESGSDVQLHESEQDYQAEQRSNIERFEEE